MLTPLFILAALAAPPEEPAEADDASAARCTTAVAPTGGWPVALGKNTEDLDAFLFPSDLDWDDKDRRGTRTDGVVIVYQGQVIYERYAHGYDVDTPHLAWSATKSFINALTGIAVKQGRLSLDDSICDHIEVGNPESCQVKVRHLLEFSSGWDWLETYEGYSPRNSSVLAMLYGEGRDDMARFVSGHAFRDAPGESWMYSSGDTNVLSAVVGAVLAPEHGDRFPFALLLEPIGMDSAVWERDGAGTYVGSSYLYATPRDLARFGHLFLQDGCWGDTEILPDGWVAASTQVSDAIRKKPLGRDDGDVQGRQFWLNRPIPEQDQDRPWPDVPENVFAAKGHWKQSISVFPDNDLIVVRVADDRDGEFDDNRFLRLAMELAGEGSAQ